MKIEKVSRAIARRTLPLRDRKRLVAMRTRLLFSRRGVVKMDGFRVRIDDRDNFYMMYKDIFVRRIYGFSCPRPDPSVIDLGSNIGVSVLYAKRTHPSARITAVEADPLVLPLLQENLARNGLHNVRVLHAAVGAGGLAAEFRYGGGAGSGLVSPYRGTVTGSDLEPLPATFVQQISLRTLLEEPVDFLKMNVEGAELDILVEAQDGIRQIDQMVIEYHHLPGLPRTFHRLLALLDDAGFEYLVNAFDKATNPGVQPPFRLTPETRYFLLVYARRRL
jgi:FkbM family methyltransferase